jgi:hypothetical protein
MKVFASLLAILVVLCFADAFHTRAPKNRPMKGSTLQMTVLSYGGKKKDFKAGSSLKSAVASLGVKPKYSCTKYVQVRSIEQTPQKRSYSSFFVVAFFSNLFCNRGDCGSCTLSVGGSRMRPCVAKVPPEPKLKSLQEKGLEVK